MPEEEIGKVTRYFAKIGVAGILIEKGGLKVGETIHIKGHTTDFNETISSMQVEGKDVEEANPGDEIGVKLGDRARPNDVVYKVIPE
ncbi:MAG: EF-Tu/IF-2/RF-3 family GTPase [Planctomycetota bacterium]|jgi:putative protease